MENLIIQKNDKILIKYEQGNDKSLIKHKQRNIYFNINSAAFSRICLLCHNKINKGDLYGFNRYKIYCLECCQKNIIKNEGPPEKKARKIIKCRYCRQKSEHSAFGLCGKCYRKKYRKEHYEEIHAYRRKNAKKIKEYRKEYQNKNRDRIRIINKEWVKRNKHKNREINKLAVNKKRFSGNREKVLKRDKYRCQICGTKEKLAIHHLDGIGYYSERKVNNSLENLIVLCSSCHRGLHAYIEFSKILIKYRIDKSKFIKISNKYLDTNQGIMEDNFEPTP